MRQYQEDIDPGLSEQFAGMGAGGLTSSGFRNAAVGAGTDLSERLGAIRAQLRQQGAAGLSGLAGMGLQNYSQDVMTQPGTPGMLSQVSPLIGQAIAAYASGGASAAPAAASSLFNSFGKNAMGGTNVGKNTSPYGNSPIGPQQNFQLPNRSF